MSKKISQTESIEVPIEIAKEVKLFINLLKTGEISSLGELFAKAEPKKPDLFDLMRSDDLWNEVLNCICPPMTQALFRQQGQLLNINISEAVVGPPPAILKGRQNNMAIVRGRVLNLSRHPVNLVRDNPWREMNSLQSQLNRLFDCCLNAKLRSNNSF